MWIAILLGVVLYVLALLAVTRLFSRSRAYRSTTLRPVTADDPLCPGECIGNYVDPKTGGRYPCDHYYRITSTHFSCGCRRVGAVGSPGCDDCTEPGLR